MTVSIWLLMFVVIPIGLCIVKSRKEFALSFLSLAVINFLVIYFYIVGTSEITGAIYTYQLEQFDADGDGIYTHSSEATDEENTAFAKVMNYNGRSTAVFGGFFTASVHSLLFLLILGVGHIWRRRAN